MAIIFWFLAFIVSVASLGAVLLRNVMHSALLLGVALFGVAGIFLILGGDFLAAVQITVYVSGILILMLFVVMLTHRIYDRTLAQSNKNKFPAMTLCACIFAALFTNIYKENFALWTLSEPQTTVAALGKLMLTDYVVPFELASVLLLAAMVGAILFTKREPGEE